MVRTLTALLALAVFASSVPALPSAPPNGPTGIGLIEIERAPRERASAAAALFEHPEQTLRSLIDAVDRAGNDPDLHGLVVRLRGASLSPTQIEELGTAIERLRASGRKVHVFSEAYDRAELMLGCYADQILIQSGGPVSLIGLYSEEIYLADTLEWIGVKADFIQVGDYKGASEALTRNAPSPQWDANINALLDSLFANLRTRIKTGRNLDDAQLDNAMRRAWIANHTTAREVGLIDAAMDLPEISAHLERFFNAGNHGLEWTNMLDESQRPQRRRIGNPLTLLGRVAAPPPMPTRDTIAVLHIDGPIVDGESRSGGFSGNESVGSWTVRRSLGDIEDDDRIKGMIVRINSPGGSAIASEIIWQGVRRVAAKKPVWVSVGSMAASGGYYIAVAGDRIYVNPSSIVGSIGVVGGKLSLAGLHTKLKLRTHGRARGPMADLMSSEPWTDEQRALVRTRMTEVYDLFAARVTTGRPGIDLARTAEGRLFTGSQAVDLKMADRLGGLQEAVNDMAKELKLEPGRFDLLDYPEPLGVGELFAELLGGASASSPDAPAGAALTDPLSPLSAAIREAVGPDHWPAVRDHLTALTQLRHEPVILASPRIIILK
ncbi:MAG: S49 family peptidase [Phycisphaeraceae bacterium]|nr:S49 family peptidase [Phycisphaeraceae bacterium]